MSLLTATANMRRYLIDVSARRQGTKILLWRQSLPDHHASIAAVRERPHWVGRRRTATMNICQTAIAGLHWGTSRGR